jgi:sugar lactone lactonase YvrE
VVVDGAGRVWFSDLRRIWKIDEHGRLSEARAAGDRHTHELAIDAAGAVYGEDSYYDPDTATYRAALWRFTPEGRFEFLLPPTASPPVGLTIWRDSEGRTYVADQAARGSADTLLFRRERDGRVTRLLGDAGAAGRYRPDLASNIGGAAVGPDGAFYFRHRSILRRVTKDGRVEVLSTDLPGENFGIAVGRSGQVYVADFGGRRILRIDRAARPTTVLTAEAPWAPTGVFLRGADLYVLEGAQDRRGVTERLRVRHIPAHGPPSVLATVPVS